MSRVAGSRLDRLDLPRGSPGRVWLFRRSPEMAYFHRHHELELNLVVSGTALNDLGERRYRMGPGSLCWLFPDQDHLLVEQSRDLVMWIAVFAPTVVARAARGGAAPLAEQDPAGLHCRRLTEIDAGDLGHCLHATRDCGGDPSLFAQGLAFALRLAWHAYQRAPASGDGAVHPAVARAAALLEQEPGLATGALARRCGLSRARLSQRFRRDLGETILARRERLRVERFLRRREERPGASLLADALTCGFGSYAQFHRAFRRVTGMTPGMWGRGHFG